MVSITVIMILIALLTPTLAAVNRTAQQVVCSSNVRQIGIGILFFADDHRDRIPQSAFVTSGPNARYSPEQMMKIRVERVPDSVPRDDWDGLGHLFVGEYLPVAGLYYCPAHKGEHPISRYNDMWNNAYGTIFSNYQYRGRGPGSEMHLTRIEPSQAALVTDGLRSQLDFSHGNGCNVLRADISVVWYADTDRKLFNSLPASPGEITPGTVTTAWQQLDPITLRGGN